MNPKIDFIPDKIQPKTSQKIDFIPDKIQPSTPYSLSPIEENIKNVGKNILQAIPNLAKLGLHSGEEIVDTPIKAAQDVGRGIGITGQDMLHNIDAALQQPHVRKAFQDLFPVASPVLEVEKERGSPLIGAYKGTRTPITKDTEFMLGLLPLSRGAKLGEELTLEAAKSLPEFIGKKIATKAAGLGAGGALTAPLLGISPTQGALTNLLLPTAQGAISKGITKIAPGLGKSGKLTVKEAQKRIKAAKETGINLPIGDIFDAPILKKGYAVSKTLFGSGANKPYTKLLSHILNIKDKLINRSTEPVGDVNQNIFDKYKKAYLRQKDKTNEAYNYLTQVADEHQVPIDINDFHERLRRNNEKINKRIQANPILEDMYGDSVKLNDTFLKQKVPGFENAHNLRMGLSDLFKNTPHDKKIYRNTIQNATKAMEETIDKSLTNAQAADLKNAYRAAKDARIKQATFERMPDGTDSPFYKAYIKGADEVPNFISQYLKASTRTKDFRSYLKALTQHLSSADKKQIADSYLETDNVGKLYKKLSDLNSAQRKELLEEDHPDAENLIKLVNMYPEVKSADFIPKTGFTGAQGTQLGGAAVLGMQALERGDLLGAALIGGIVPAIGQTVQRTLRSPLLRDIYLKGLERTEATPPVITKPSSLLNTLRGATILGMQNNA